MAAPQHPEAFVRWLRQVTPYVHAFRGRTFVVGFGGEMFAERARFASFIHDVNLLAALGIRLVLVPGARPQIEAELKAKGLRSRYAQGLRITDDAALMAVKHAAGVLRVELEALLSQGRPGSAMGGARLPTNRNGAVLGELTAREAEPLAKKAPLTPQSARAIEHAVRAVGGGVARAHVITRSVRGALLLELFTHTGVGTMITADAVEKLRPARIEDVRGMLELIEPLEADGTLVKRSRELLEAEIGNFLVVDHDGTIVGCAALYPVPEDKSAEFACLAVAGEYRDAGYGERLLKACEERAKALRLRRLFALTTRAAHWFLEQGFRAAAVSALPQRRQALYNWRRGARVFRKRI